MASDLDICNLALSLVGSDALVTAIDPADGSAEAGHCARFLPMVRRELLDSHPFSFAKKRVELAEVSNPSTTWVYAYQIPSDCIAPRRVLQSLSSSFFSWAWAVPGVGVPVSADELVLIEERGGASYEIEGQKLLTNEPEAVLIYAADPNGRASPTFEMAEANLLAAYLAGPLIKGSEGAKTAAVFRQQVFGPDGRTGLAGKARAIDANKSSEPARGVADSIKARA